MSGVARIASLIRPIGSQGFTLVLSAYVDASDPNSERPVAAVAGFVSNSATWAKFETKWMSFLDKFGLKRFHATHYWARTGEFARWGNDEAKFAEVRRDICDILNDCVLFGIGAAVSVNAFEEWRMKHATFFSSDPVYFCLERTLRHLIVGMTEIPVDEGVVIYVDRDKGREKLARDIASWHESRLRNLPEIGWLVNPKRSITTIYGSSIDYVPLQAADILSNSAYRHMASIISGMTTAEPEFIACMRSMCAVQIIYYNSAEAIDLDLKSMMVRGHPS